MVEKTVKGLVKNSFQKKDVRYSKELFEKLRYFMLSPVVQLSVIGLFTGRASIMETLSPFGTALLVSLCRFIDIKSTAIIGIFIIAGAMMKPFKTGTLESVICMMIVFAAIKWFKFDKHTKTIKISTTVFAANFVVSLIVGLVFNRTLTTYDVLMGLFGSAIIIALMYIYNYCIPIIMNRRIRMVLGNEETICMSIVCGIVITGLSDISVLNISIKSILSLLLVAMAAYSQGPGVGAAIGTTLGLISYASSSNAPAAIGIYTMCGLLCGIFKGMGKLASAAGFAAGGTIILLYTGPEGNIIGYREMIAALCLFIVMPSVFIKRIVSFIGNDTANHAEQQWQVERAKDMIKSQISRVVDVFGELSKSLEEDGDSEKIRHSSEINAVIDSVVDKVCPDCDARSICWERDLYNTYQSMFQMIDVIQSDDKLDMENMPQDLKKKCLRVHHLMKSANYIYEIYRMNYKWRRKAQESKKVVGEQLQGVAGILRQLSGDMGEDVKYEKDVEEEIAVALDREGVNCSDIMAYKDGKGKTHVNIYRKACLGRRECIKDVAPAVSKAINKKMIRDKANCVLKNGTSTCCFHLTESVNFQVSVGVSRESKDSSGVSGDNYSFIDLSDGKYMIALSDGMGTGPAAAMESNSAITLLEKYLEAGFDRSTTLKSINSILSLKTPDDNFATIDLCIADLYNAEVEFIKIGAASTYIKRSNGFIETISSTTLPIGIIDNVDIESKYVKLNDGDFIIMITDGVQESGQNGDKWILYALEDINTRNPQQMADEILSRAKERDRGKIRDDMTVLVAKIWRII